MEPFVPSQLFISQILHISQQTMLLNPRNERTTLPGFLKTSRDLIFLDRRGSHKLESLQVAVSKGERNGSAVVVSHRASDR